MPWDGDVLVERAQADEQPGVRHRASRGHHDRVHDRGEVGHLLDQLGGGGDVAEGAQRRVVRPERDHVRAPAGGLQLRGERAQRGVRAGLVFALGVLVAHRAEQVIEQHVARGVVGVAHIGTRSSSWTWRLHPEAGGHGGRGTRVVRLDGAGDQHGVGALCLGFAEVELELSHLVPAERDAGQVVALDQHP